jgi:hypothetical protein
MYPVWPHSDRNQIEIHDDCHSCGAYPAQYQICSQEITGGHSYEETLSGKAGHGPEIAHAIEPVT